MSRVSPAPFHAAVNLGHRVDGQDSDGGRSHPADGMNAGPELNSGFSDERYVFRGGGTTLNFMSDGRGGAGYYDLWKASRAR